MVLFLYQAKKLLELSKLNPKIKKVVPVIDVWKNMTVQELAQSSGRPVNDILEALFFIDNQTEYDGTSIFEDPQTVFETVKKLGSKYRVVSSPSSRKKDESTENKDVVRR